ncbi:hypothetical protein ScalyP_jg11514 [Parmales sp. scaly parma]|nr:hypothetical protein ScalyP_jg11514 [Parmales sp. scaly parma]
MPSRAAIKRAKKKSKEEQKAVPLAKLVSLPPSLPSKSKSSKKRKLLSDSGSSDHDDDDDDDDDDVDDEDEPKMNIDNNNINEVLDDSASEESSSSSTSSTPSTSGMNPSTFFSPKTSSLDIPTSALSANAFQWLISPLPIKDFHSSHYGKSPVLIRRNPTPSEINVDEKLVKVVNSDSSSSTYYSSIISSAEVFTYVKKMSLKYGEDINVTNVVNGVRRTLDILPSPTPATATPTTTPTPIIAQHNDVLANYNSGCSIRLLCPQKYSTSTYRLLSTLEENLSCMVGANLYLTPRGSQGFAPHYDDVDVFILQVEGEKRWRVYEPITPEEVLPRTSSTDFDMNSLPLPVLDVVLKAGDMLYLPRGWIHQAVTDSSCPHSLHLTVSAMYGWCWADYMEVLLPEAIKRAVNGPSKSLREGMPTNFMDYMGIVNDNDDDNDNDTDNDTALKTTAKRAEFKDLVKGKIARIAKEAMAMVDQASDELALKFLSDRLPPALTPFELISANQRTEIDDAGMYEAEAEAEEEEEEEVEVEVEDFKNADIFLSSKVRLLRKGIARLIIEDDKAVLYHSMDNSKTFHEVPLSPLEFELDDAPAIEKILKTFAPDWCLVNDLPHPPAEDSDDKIGICKSLFEEGILAVDNRELL